MQSIQLRVTVALHVLSFFQNSRAFFYASLKNLVIKSVLFYTFGELSGFDKFIIIKFSEMEIT